MYRSIWEEENVLTASNERIEAVTAMYVLEDGQTAVAAMDITENTDLVTYADVDETGRKSGTISVTEADLNSACFSLLFMLNPVCFSVFIIQNFCRKFKSVSIRNTKKLNV